MNTIRTSRFTRVAREEKTMQRLNRTITVPLVATVSAFAFALPAHADTTSNCQTSSNGSQVCDVHKTASSNVNGSFHVTSHAFVGTEGMTVLTYQLKDGYKKHAHGNVVDSFAEGMQHHKCFVVSAKMKGQHFQNSGTRSGVRTYFDDYVGSKYTPVGSKFCWDPVHHTWRKANCGNFVKFHGTPKLKVNKVLLVRTLSQLKVELNGYITKKLHEELTATAWCSGSGTSASATVQGFDTLVVKIKVHAVASSYSKAKSKGSEKALLLASQQDLALTQQVDVQAHDSLNGNVSVTCSNTPPPNNNAPSVSASAQSCVQQGQANGVITGVVSNPNNAADTARVTIGSKTVTVSVAANGTTSFTLSGYAPGTYQGTATLQGVNLSTSFTVQVQQCQPQTPQHFTQISCVWPEEITVGAGVYVDCSVSDDNGAQIALSVSTDANSRASGIICTTNGQPACPSGGTFEFFIQGVNQGNTTVVATATANGVPASSSATFPVDPSSSGF